MFTKICNNFVPEIPHFPNYDSNYDALENLSKAARAGFRLRVKWLGAKINETKFYRVTFINIKGRVNYSRRSLEIQQYFCPDACVEDVQVDR
jgi:hypothetical protein